MLRKSPSAVLVFLVFCLSLPAFADAHFTTRNDDSCDVMVLPAATLLLPYFEVDLTSPSGTTTLFTVSNVAPQPQIAHVTIWTDWSFPVVDFDIFLTGYDVQSINLYDIIVRGRVAEPGTSKETDPGARSRPNRGNPLLNLNDCDHLAVTIPSFLLADMQNALAAGRTSRCPSTTKVGGTHANAVGYITIDVVSACRAKFPTDADYASTLLLYDNVLTGDYQQVNSSQNFAQSGPMVHIRAFPEGGAPGAKTTNLTQTFYGIYQNGGTADRRQPLPATFGGRWINAGTTGFNTTYKIWRQGRNFSDACSTSQNSRLDITEFVRFDEDENPTTVTPDVIIDPLPPAGPFLPSVSRINSSGSEFPPNPDGAVAGWMYMNLDNGLQVLSGGVSQNWVVVSMAAEGRYSGDFDAAALGNGCSPRVPITDEDGGLPAIEPARSADKTFTTGSPSTLNNDQSCDIMVTPAATLLVPYFEVDLTSQSGETTLFTVTNVTRFPQIAHVTLWTDWSYPMLSFDVFLTGYDVQAINLYDIIVRGMLAPPGTSSRVDEGRRSAPNDGNPLIDVANCGQLPLQLGNAAINELQKAFTIGRTSSCGTSVVGGTHFNATGYVTVDVVASCGAGLPADPGYFASNILYDNVLIGDYDQVNSTENSAQANPMVHIRAVPEGGAAGSRAMNFPRTFYGRLQNGGNDDRRQPLPSTFAARWIRGGAGGFETSFKIWREGRTAATAGCAVSANGRADYVEFVRFDESENPTVASVGLGDPPYFPNPRLPSATRLFDRDSGDLPPLYDQADVAGWLYMNLDSAEAPQVAASQAWVVVSMAAEQRYSVDFDAMAFGNGCSAAVPKTDEEGGTPAIEPAGMP